MNNEPTWLYISFCGQRGFLGGIYVQQRPDDGRFVIPTWQVDDFPAERPAQAVICQIPAEKAPADHRYHNRLLTRKELEEIEPMTSLKEAKDAARS